MPKNTWIDADNYVNNYAQTGENLGFITRGHMIKLVKLQVTIITAALVLVLAGCTTANNGTTENNQVIEYNGHFSINGSSAGMPVIKLLTAAFSKKHPGVSFEFKSGAKTSAALQQLKNGAIDIVVYAKDLKPEEQDSKIRFDVLVSDPIVIVVNKTVPVDGLTTTQIKNIYTGKTTTWGDNNDSAIIVCDRIEDETAKIAIRKFVLGKDLSVTDHAIILETESEMADAIASTPYSIGYYSLAKAKTQDSVKVLKVDGVAPNVSNLKTSTYGISRPVGIATMDQDETIKQFISFAYSKEAKELLVKNGYLPLEPKR